MKKRRRFSNRLIPNEPIESKYDGICLVCKRPIEKNEFISPFFDSDKNLWRHHSCKQLFYLNRFIYENECNICSYLINKNKSGYRSKHNGVWCEDCGETLFPKVYVAYSHYQEDLNLLKKLRA